MKKLISLLIAATALLTSCKKESNTATVLNETLPMQGTTLATGNFLGNAHATTGTVRIVKDASNKLYLVFDNFRTDNGPDLKVWLSPNTGGNPYQELGLLKAVSGNFSYELDATINYTTNNRVLIWCRQFSILFGHAVLQ